ncbi:MAG: glucokinase [Phycisphaerae bacterium]|nr:glucokinase [Phycisphaerae bacterium]
MTRAQAVVGIDLGGTNTLACVMDESGEIRSRTHRKTDAHLGTDAVVDGLAEAVREVCDTAGIELDAVDGVGVAVCGAVDHGAGVVLATGALDWTDVPLSAMLKDRLGRRVILENDVNAAAWGEYRAGAGRGAAGMLAAWVGTGIGGGIVLDDRLYHGPRGTAGELGQTKVDNTGREPRILEAIASRTGMRTLASELAGDFSRSMLLESVGGDFDAIGTDQIAAAHAAGDPLAERVVSIAAEVLGSSLANAVTLLSIDTIVLGGGMIESLGDAFVDQIRTGFEADVFPPQAASWCRIVPTMLRSDAGLVGAAMIAAEDSRSR